MNRIIILVGLALCLSACSQETGQTTVEAKPAGKTEPAESNDVPKVEPSKEQPVKSPTVGTPVIFEMQISGMS